ncbi:hypothetical protein [Anatilimnocola floriformis]|uniref:hypothetical protein n=1 Tax=Anatilimnocola floriformis TaxID=2948575 RepID=UPI0020C45AAA|nr:hypothetical protein [Anatilimnocola floriformis]
MPPRPVKPKPSLPKRAPEPPKPKPQFTILGMFVVMLICSMASAGAYYLVRADGNDPSFKLIALLFLLAGPMLLMVAVSILVAVAARWK